MAILLTCLSGFIHAGWNFVVKKNATKFSFFLISNCLCSLILLPVFFFNIELTLDLFYSSPIKICLSILCQISYLYFLFLAYSKGEMSIVYPIARTIPIPLALFIELVFDRDRVFSSGYTIGVIILCLGSLLLANLKKSSKLKNSIFFACISAIAICGYSLLDHSVLRSLELLSVSENITVCIVYMFILEVGISFGLAIPLLINKAFRVDVINELINNKIPCMQMGVGMISSYILVLIAMTYAQQASLIIAFRQISIPIGFLLGVFLLKESNHKIKWVGIITISSGLIFLGLIQ